MQKLCLRCKKEFKTFPAWIKLGGGKFCSRFCSGKYNAEIGKIGFKKGHPDFTSPEARKKQGRSLSKTFSGAGNPMWRGDNIGRGVHTWVMKTKGRAKDYMCWFSCGNLGQDWANIDHTYKRKADDYLPMCRKCHMNYDYKLGLRTYKRKPQT